MYDISQGKCQIDAFDTVFDKLEFENPNVANCVIDQCRAEKILLIGEDYQAQQIMKNESTAPTNCLFALTNGFNQYYPAPSYRTYALDINPVSITWTPYRGTMFLDFLGRPKSNDRCHLSFYPFFLIFHSFFLFPSF